MHEAVMINLVKPSNYMYSMLLKPNLKSDFEVIDKQKSYLIKLV